MGEMVIVAYRPKPGREAELDALTREHVPSMRGLGRGPARPPRAMRTAAGVVVEVFEWRDGGIEAAHHDPQVHAMWKRYEAVCDYVPLVELPEALQLFGAFKPIEL